MIRFAARLSLMAFAIGFVSGPALAGPAPRHARKAARVARPPAPARSAAGNINAHSTDFSKVERADGDETGPRGGGLRPVMGAGGMGLGGGF